MIDEKLKRLNVLIRHLIWKGELSFLGTQKDIAQKISANEVSVSRALNGNKEYLTDSFIERINNAYGNLFNTEWLITGEGEMEIKNEEYNPVYSSNLLHHYTTSAGLIGILRDMKLNFSKQKKSNDIKERRLSEHDQLKSLKSKEKEKEAAKYKWVSFFIRDENRVKQPKMYDLYADRHSGGCIEFCKKKLEELNSQLGIEFCEIKYDAKFLKQQSEVKEEIKHKYYQWRDEKECRIIYYGDAKSVKIDIDCIERIYLGDSFFDDIIKVGELCEIIEEKDIPIEKITQVMATGIGFLHSVSDENSSSITKTSIQVPKLLPYLSEEYRRKYNIVIEEYKRINYREEKYYKEKYFELLEENDIRKENKDEDRLKADAEHWRNRYYEELESSKGYLIEINRLTNELRELEKKPAVVDSAVSDARIETGT